MRKIRVELSEQVVAFVSQQPPESRRHLRRGLRGLEREAGDIRALEGRLAGWHRLRIGAFRVLFRYVAGAGGPLIRCDFAARRDMVYVVFEQMAGRLR